MKKIFFVTGTDTDCGKTYCTVNLMRELKSAGKTVVGLKPLASGANITPQGLRNDDGLKLQAESSFDLPYEIINPVCFEPHIAPHIAADEIGKTITARSLINSIQPGLTIDCDIVLIEGAGGLMVPLNHDETWIDFIKQLNIPVIFIVGLKIGCINHSLLSLSTLKQYNIPIEKIIYNRINPNMSMIENNIESIQNYLNLMWLAC